MAATLGAGEQDDDVFQALAEYDAVTVGGTYDVKSHPHPSIMLIALALNG
jgi:hypothetical protein